MSGPRLDAPDSQNSRVFVGNVAINTDEDLLAEHFKKHGNVLGCIVLKGFAFVQFEKEEEAQKAIAAENGVEFQGRKMDVKAAKKKAEDKREEQPPQQHQYQQQQQSHEHFQRNQPSSYHDQPFGGNERPWTENRGGRGGFRGGRGGFRGRQAPYNRRDQYGETDYQGDNWDRQGRHGPGSGYGDDYNNGRGGGYRGGNADMMDTSEHKNDCEIVCVSKQQRLYAEKIEARLRNLGLRIDILFPNPDIPIAKILENIASRGILFAVVITPINEQHQSLTLNVLQGVQQEHRNMPLEDAIAFMAKNFEAIVEGKSAGLSGNDGMPEDIRTVVGFLMDNRPLSVMEYDKLIRFLAGRREGMLRLEYGENIPPSLANPPIGPPVEPAFKAKQDELFERIIQILNKPAPVKEPAKSAAPVSIAPELNASLQRAIDSLIKTGPNLLSQMNSKTTGSSTTGSLHSQTGGASGYNMSYGRDSY